MIGIILALTALQPKEILDAGKNAASTLSQTQWGSIVVILFIILVLLGALIWKAKNDHLKDKDKMHSLLNDQAKEAVALTTTMSNMCKVMNERLDDVERGMDEKLTVLDGQIKSGFESTCKSIDAHVMSCPSSDKAKYMSRRGGS